MKNSKSKILPYHPLDVYIPKRLPRWRATGEVVEKRIKSKKNPNLPKNHSIWLVFDLDNGHEPSKHYCWWFNTKKDADNHISFQKQYKNAAKLSKPTKLTKDY